MNTLVKNLLQEELRRAEDNLYRARLQQQHDPTWCSGNGESLTDVISGYAARRDEILAAMKE